MLNFGLGCSFPLSFQGIILCSVDQITQVALLFKIIERKIMSFLFIIHVTFDLVLLIVTHGGGLSNGWSCMTSDDDTLFVCKLMIHQLITLKRVMDLGHDNE